MKLAITCAALLMLASRGVAAPPDAEVTREGGVESATAPRFLALLGDPPDHRADGGLLVPEQRTTAPQATQR